MLDVRCSTFNLLIVPASQSFTRGVSWSLVSKSYSSSFSTMYRILLHESTIFDYEDEDDYENDIKNTNRESLNL